MNPAIVLAFGPLLKRYRRAVHLTQAQLAERAGFSTDYISKLERGAREPRRATVARLADVLDLSTGDRKSLETIIKRSGVAHDGEATLMPIGAFLGATPASPLVGREAELGAIAVALEAVASGQGRLLTLSGDPGMGKTRLAQEITLLAHAQGFRVLTGRCYEPQQSVAYYPFLEALALAAAGTGGDAHAPLSAHWPEVARLLPDHPATAQETNQAPAQIDDRAAQQRLFWQVTSFLRTLAEQRPLALVLDDLHWVDSASLDLLQHLARHTRDRRILLVGTYRDLEVTRPLAAALHDLNRDELVERITVRPLAAEETTALIGATLGAGEGGDAGAASVSPHLAHLIQQRSEGNAFFTRQLARALQEQGELHFADGQWRLSASAPPALHALETIRVVIGQRLARLTPRTQDFLREASVLGQVFAFPELQQMSERGEQEMEEALEEAARAGIVREGQRDQYDFNHALTLDTLYTELSARRKRRLHRAAADAIEEQSGHEWRAAELAYHLLAADEGARALPYTLLAGDQAEVVYAHTEAEAHYRAAARLGHELSDQALEAEAREKLGVVLGLVGSSDEAIELLKGALHRYETLGNERAELRALAELLEIWGLYGREMVDDAAACAQVILTRLEPPDPSALTPALASGLAAVYRGLSGVYFGSGDREEQVSAARRAADLARIAGDDAQLAWALHRLYATGLVPDDLAVRQEILALAERSGQSVIIVAAHNMLGYLYTQEGDFAQSIAHMEQSVAVAEQRQDLVNLAWQLNNFTEFLFYAGDWQRMRKTAARAASILQEADPAGTTWQAAVMSFWPGNLALLDGREEEGRRLVERATKSVQEIGIATLFEGATFLLAETDLLAGDAEAVQLRLTALLHASEQLIQEEAVIASILLAWAEGMRGQPEHAGDRVASMLALAKPLYLVDALRIQGLLATMQGRWDMATKALDEALERTRAMPYPYAEAKSLWAYGRLEAARGYPQAARERFTAALAICDQLGEGLYLRHIQHDLEDLDALSASYVQG